MPLVGAARLALRGREAPKRKTTGNSGGLRCNVTSLSLLGLASFEEPY